MHCTETPPSITPPPALRHPTDQGPATPEVYATVDAVVCLPEPPSPPAHSSPSCHECWLRWLTVESSLRTCLRRKAAASPRSCPFLRRQPPFCCVASKTENIYSLSSDRKGFLTPELHPSFSQLPQPTLLLWELPFPQKGPTSGLDTSGIQIQLPPFTMDHSLTLHFADLYN